MASRSAPQFRVDLATGGGLAAALDGCKAVADALPGAGAASQRLRAVGERGAHAGEFGL